MADVLHLNKAKSPETLSAPADGRIRVDRSEWPDIVARRRRGESKASIARRYGVTGPTISNILKKAEEVAITPDSEVASAESSPGPSGLLDNAGDGAETVTEDTVPRASGSRDGAAGRTTLRAPSRLQDDAQTHASTPSREAKAAQSAAHDATAVTREASDEASLNAAFQEPLASGGIPAAAVPAGAEVSIDAAEGQRLLDTARACAQAFEENVSETAMAAALHEVRRALAAIDIAHSRQISRVEKCMEAEEDTGDDAEESLATVKFFRADKGFGFVVPDDGSADVFLPANVVEAAGLGDVQKGQRVLVTYKQGAKGREVAEIDLA